jgi:hypothetical protein
MKSFSRQEQPAAAEGFRADGRCHEVKISMEVQTK